MPTKRSPTNSIDLAAKTFQRSAEYWNVFFTVNVEGESMWPELVPGKRYFATSLFKPNTGDYIVFKNPKNQNEAFVKKVKKIIDGSCEVGGAVPWSSSSEEFGPVPNELILGKIILPRLFPLRGLQKQKLPTIR